ncbi:hypothetical protein TSTA_101720 [Talaromyces stipitatus ATCC 10500]|uniref:Zn(2)-C6 fungal-type domain-containing protein n=1 Tax=Talaromyces stipitatus (strain ATCC 10500 / CBS 375.48 / QM 6759 / NRRL 1006) TaxID=441959 RepID=B8MMY7_TALSN|nr:uncharacterized protein TSTA_101720 [Talaromyces stipitatus ATCC 10500]EED13936.1 hypothetical protein TSTA_101720 [Talaromyces stipitatus ATCC 10500]
MKFPRKLIAREFKLILNDPALFGCTYLFYLSSSPKASTDVLQWHIGNGADLSIAANRKLTRLKGLTCLHAPIASLQQRRRRRILGSFDVEFPDFNVRMLERLWSKIDRCHFYCDKNDWINQKLRNMLLVQNDGDLFAVSESYSTLTDVARFTGNFDLWLEALAECGLDVKQVLAADKKIQRSKLFAVTEDLVHERRTQRGELQRHFDDISNLGGHIPGSNRQTRYASNMTTKSEQQQRKTRQKACNACIKSKRRCDLQHPSCRRCVIKGIACVYSSTRLHDHVSAASPDSSPDSSTGSSSNTTTSIVGGQQHAIPVYNENQQPPLLFHYQDDGLRQTLFQSDHYFLNNSNYITQPMQFFLSPGTWIVADSTASDRDRTHRSVHQLNSSVHQVRCWLKQWVEEGSNMFVHKRLYYAHDNNFGSDGRGRLQMSRCIQDAYTTCAAYFTCTSRNKQMVLGLVEERVATLLEEKCDEEDRDVFGNTNEVFDFSSPSPRLRIMNNSRSEENPAKPRSVLDHLARVQALLIYQIIRLFDGDPRSRMMAESLIPVLSRWCKNMIDSALLSSEYVHSAATISNTASQANIEKRITSDWNAWILAESVRRTWLVAGHMQCFYRLLSYGITVCPGGVMFTTRAGLWQADSAYEWWAKCREKDVLFCPSLESGRYLLRPGVASPEDIDDFGRFVLQIIEGEERVNKWLSVS